MATPITATQTLTVVVDGVPLIQDFSATRELLAPGQETVLRWNVVGADSVSIEPEIGDVNSTGEATVTPAETTAYKLRTTNANGIIVEWQGFEDTDEERQAEASGFYRIQPASQ